MNPFSRIAALFVYFETFGIRNYTNTIYVTPDELVGTWMIHRSNDYHCHAQVEKTKLILHPDQTFEIEYPINILYNAEGTAPNIPQKYVKWNSDRSEIIHLRGDWGMSVCTERSDFWGPNCTNIIGRYEGEKECVSLGQVLDRHVSTPHNRFAIKWWREDDESYLRPAYGIYLKKDILNPTVSSE